jgi:cobyrinic acid a,c-diamide synthase
MCCYAECGGLMVLAEALKLNSGQCFSMAGVVPGMVEMTKQLQHFGYCKVNSHFGEIRGHEFHYSYWTEETKQANLWEVICHSTGTFRKEGYRTSNLHASYVHLYFPQAETLIRKVFQLLPDVQQ